MSDHPRALDRLVHALARFPGIGPRTARRLAFHAVSRRGDAEALAHALTDAVQTLSACRECHGLATSETCAICADPDRDGSVICVVEEARDVFALEKAAVFRGRYHVLGGAISPLEGIGPEELNLADLPARVRDGGVQEVILATDADPEGETTAAHVAELLRPAGVALSRIGFGLPSGAQLEYTDASTLIEAFGGRRTL